MKPLDFGDLWTPELAPGEVMLRAAVIYVFVQLVFRVVGPFLERSGKITVVLRERRARSATTTG